MGVEMYLSVNRANWDERAPVHVASSGYDEGGTYVEDPRFIGHVVHPDHPGEWRLADRPWRLADSYTLQAVKEG